MLYFIDSANTTQIEDALSLGVVGVTANASMYKKEQISLAQFVDTYATYDLPFLSAEVMGTYEEMYTQAMQLHKHHPNLVIKINFSKEGLQLVKTLHVEGVKTALTLIFTMAQAIAAVNAGCDYLFFFIGRNEELGVDALSIIEKIQEMIMVKHYSTKVVAASIKNLYQLERLGEFMIDYAAIPYDLYIKSFYHPLTSSGAETFVADFKDLKTK